MKRPGSSRFAPVLSGVFLYALLGAFAAFASAVIPWLLELGEISPRLAALGWLALLTSPVPFVAIVHRMTHGMMDRFDVTKEAGGARPGVASLWAGLFAWFAMWSSSLISAFLTLALFPPPPEEGAVSAVLRVVEDVKLRATVHSALWVSVAAILYAVERRARARDGE
jgi:hypothetical protein